MTTWAELEEAIRAAVPEDYEIDDPHTVDAHTVRVIYLLLYGKDPRGVRD